MKTDGESVSSKDEIDALTATFFRAVSFREGGEPTYATLSQLFLKSGRVIKNSPPLPEICTVHQFIVPGQRMIDAHELTVASKTTQSLGVNCSGAQRAKRSRLIFRGARTTCGTASIGTDRGDHDVVFVDIQPNQTLNNGHDSSSYRGASRQLWGRQA
jgi:hypothetical protein